ncbi:Maf family protein [Myxococcus stipitatus]|uniref:Maf family protein n=1 Tax=Myxococcus stipitatus TaxID=83455 RepID=UPI001F433507|nr:Maf family protein [Myxococcus stipitatus]MCE9666846.1 Maf family protein [Myxococcus stipitatus]
MHTHADQTLLVLASGSPRRRDFLTQLGLTFTVCAADIDETPHPGEEAAPYVLRLAREKARVVATRYPGAWVLAADTTVALGNSELLGKPQDAAEACAMLGRLSGRTHDVFTGVALAGRHDEALVVHTRVTFRELTRAEIEWYAGTGEPLDRAGAYAVQGKGAFLVASVEGSPTNVIGLPLGETLALMERAGVPLAWSARR